MDNLQTKTSDYAQILKWLARIASLISAFILLLFFVGEGFNPAKLRAGEWVLMICFPLGVLAGMAIAWRRELVGGVITVACLAAFYAVNFLISGGFPRGWAFLAFSFPGFLFLAHWLLTRTVES
jgi:hypothetical protein